MFLAGDGCRRPAECESYAYATCDECAAAASQRVGPYVT